MRFADLPYILRGKPAGCSRSLAGLGNDMNFLRTITLLGLAGILLLRISFGAEREEGSNDSRALRRPRHPETTNALSSLHIKKGFRVELVAAEPMVLAPLAMAFDENGRLFVVERGDDPDSGDPHLGRIRLLEDTDGDGVYDASTVYADNLTWPSAVACYDGGVFVAATPDILYFKDARGDGVADVRKAVLTGFGRTADKLQAQTLVNSFQWGLDNRIHGATAGLGGRVVSTNAPDAAPLALGRSDFSFDPRALTILPETGPAQSGLTFDSRGRRFACDPRQPLRLAMYERRYALRNPFFPRAPEWLDVLSPATPIFQSVANAQSRPGGSRPASINPPAPAATQGTNTLAPSWFTMARGSVVYRGSAFPSNYLENVFIADPAAHLVHRAVLRESGLETIAQRAPDETNTEFLASTDASFQPMQIINGPDGALYIADKQSAATNGRIYRVVPEGFVLPKPPQMRKARTYDLVALLAHTNGWQRDTAARLLYERRDLAAAPLLTNMLNRSKVPLARLHALHTLDGLGALSDGLVLKGLGDTDARVREHAVLLSEKLLKNGALSDPLWNQLRILAADPAARVRYQLAFTLGEIRRSGRAQALAQILRRDPDEPWVRSAVLSSVADGAGALFVTLAGDAAYRSSPSGKDFLRELATMIGAQGQLNEVTQVADLIVGAGFEPQQTFAWLNALGEGLHRTRSSLALVDTQGRLQPFYAQALNALADDTLMTPLRVEAIRLLGVSPYTLADVGDLLLLLLGSGEPQEIQSAAIATLGRYNEPNLAATLLARWPVLTPVLRNEALTALLSRSNRAAAVLAALENGRVGPAELTAAQVNFLRTHPDPAISRRALQLFGPMLRERPEVVKQFMPALRLAGDASRGRRIFIARCAPCHQAGGQGRGFGPNLAGAMVNGKEKLLEAIIEPNQEVRTDYLSYVVETKGGETLLGVVTDDNPATITLSRPNNLPAVWPRANIQLLQAQPWSFMPEGLETGLTTQDMADLLQHLVSGQPTAEVHHDQK